MGGGSDFCFVYFRSRVSKRFCNQLALFFTRHICTLALAISRHLIAISSHLFAISRHPFPSPQQQRGLPCWVTGGCGAGAVTTTPPPPTPEGGSDVEKSRAATYKRLGKICRRPPVPPPQISAGDLRRAQKNKNNRKHKFSEPPQNLEYRYRWFGRPRQPGDFYSREEVWRAFWGAGGGHLAARSCPGGGPVGVLRRRWHTHKQIRDFIHVFAPTETDSARVSLAPP